jgi:hypothetical protein
MPDYLETGFFAKVSYCWLGIVGDHAVRKSIQNRSLYDVLEPVVAEGEAV